MLAILFFGFVAVRPINQANAPTLANVFADPPETKDPAKGVGSTFTIKVNVSNVVELFGWQINMTYDPAVVNTTATDIVEGPFLEQIKDTLFLKVIRNDLGYLLVTCQLMTPYPEHGASGNGTLVSITFKVRALERGTLLQFVKGTKLNTIVTGIVVPIDHTTEDGIFDNRTGNALPTADFSVDPAVANVSGTIEFNASSSYDPDAWLVRYHWDYGDGSTELYMRERLRDVNLTSMTTHAYSRGGVFTVTLTVSDSDGATATATDSVTIKGHDVAIENVMSSHLTVMIGDSATVNVTVANNGGFAETFNITAYCNETVVGTEKIIDMQPQTSTILSLTWNTTGVALGKYVLKANTSVVEDDFDTSNNEYVDGTIRVALTNVLDFPVVIGEFPFHVVVESNSTISGFRFNQPEKKMSFNASRKVGTTGICNVTIPVDLLGGPYTVLFDSSPLSVQETTNATHVFLYFTYTHTSSFHTIEIIGSTVATPPIAIFTVSTNRAIAHTQITFNASDSYDPDGSIQSYQWIFGDSNTTTTSTPIVTHAYTSADGYTITLKVKDDKQLANSTQVIVTIIDYPQADFTYSPAVPLIGETVTFDASASTPNGGSIESYQWDFGDDSTGSGAIVTHAYSNVGNYTVVLNVTDTEGLWNTKTKTVTISLHNIAITDLTATPTTVKIGQQVSIAVTVVNKGNFTETFDVTAYYNSTALETKSVADLSQGLTNTTTITWDTASAAVGKYILKANASIVLGESVTSDNSLFFESMVTIQKLTSQVSLSASLTTLNVGETSTISGTLTPTRSGVTIKIEYRLVGETSWSELGTATTDGQGTYSYDWIPSAAGNYEVKASWQGDATASPGESITEQISVSEKPFPIPLLYIAVPIIIVLIVAVMVYFLKFKK
jgi:PKD repeat protein